MTNGPDLSGLLNQAMEMQQKLAEAQEEAAATTVTGAAGGGAVEIDMTGGGEAVAVRIDADAVDADAIDELEDLVLAALTDALAKVAELSEASMGGMSDMLGGLDLGGLGGLLGGQ